MAAKKKTKKKNKLTDPRLKELSRLNFRIEFECPKLNVTYPDDFSKCLVYFPTLEKLYKIIDKYNLQAWHHFEPYVEFTIWNGNKISKAKLDKAFKEIKNLIKREKYKINHENLTGTSFFADWYYESVDEALFGIESMILTAKLSMAFWKSIDCIKEGKGKDRMIMRRFHVLCNQLAYSYIDEARVLNLRAMFSAIAATNPTMDRAKELYTKITTMEY